MCISMLTGRSYVQSPSSGKNKGLYHKGHEGTLRTKLQKTQTSPQITLITLIYTDQKKLNSTH